MVTMRLSSLPILAMLVLIARGVFACPQIDELVDFNCDQRIKMTFTGDSIVSGVGDAILHGGYPVRLRHRYANSTFNNLGNPGVRSGALLRQFVRATRDPNPSRTKTRLLNSDLILLDVGRNDFFEKNPAEFTVRNIQRLVSLLRNYVREVSDGVEPQIFVATLLPTARSFQQPFIDAVNKTLLKASSSNFRVEVRFDKVPVRLLNSDGLHPKAAGYEAMTKILENFLTGRAKALALKKRPDNDLDGVYDLFERTRFGTDDTLLDSDSDGSSDGKELFESLTDPLDATNY